jgi:purine-binding chemotaxis protein CheW
MSKAQPDGMNKVQPNKKEVSMTSKTETTEGAVAEYVTAVIGGQLFGLPISRVQDVFMPERLTRVPLSSREIAGVLNLRGRIVTVIDMRTHLSLPKADAGQTGMCVTVESRGDAYTLFVDSVGDVITLSRNLREGNPATLDAVWREVADAVYRTDHGLLVALRIDRLLAIETNS